ncbi:hypothetical protein L0657_12515 [Dyadobacter sp. CY345]|uniref:hypothetical protein n=1 Tax=Dyadobacter sp. CY345 TaxID=2909335 RepID=UPI001F390C8F|nr:hypothetical protein [Dyadobacter sp. CY345]MCF2444783.1 hypothetical protein [Dyadobacter sp. CY345]
MIKSLRNIAILGEGTANFNEKYAQLERENPTEAVIIDPDGIVNAYSYDGFAFLNETWYKKYSKNWQTDTSEIDRLLVNLVKASSSHAASPNLNKIKDYLSNPPETIEKSIEVWEGFFDPHFKDI